MTPESVTGSCGFRETLTHKKEKTGHSDAEIERGGETTCGPDTIKSVIRGNLFGEASSELQTSL